MVMDAFRSVQTLGGEKEGRGPMNSKGLAHRTTSMSFAVTLKPPCHLA